MKAPPIFILGHWRTGTTLLHEFMIRDERFGYPTTYECMDPNHFLLTEGLFTRWLNFLVPTHRPMDNMKAGFDRPQEDEFALCMLGGRLAVSDDRLSESSAAIPGISRSGKRFAQGAAVLETALKRFPQTRHL